MLVSATNRAKPLASYRCHLRRPDGACNSDSALDSIIQVKAPNAVEAARLAHLTTNKAVTDVIRIDG